MKRALDTGGHLGVQGRVRILTRAGQGRSAPGRAPCPSQQPPGLTEAVSRSERVTSPRRAPSLLISPHWAPAAGVCRARGLSAYITLVPFGRMKNLPGVYCKQAYVRPNTERKGQRIIHAPPRPPPAALCTPHQLPTPASGQRPGPVPNLPPTSAGARGRGPGPIWQP